MGGLQRNSTERVLAGTSGEQLSQEQALSFHVNKKGMAEFIVEEPMRVSFCFEGNIDALHVTSATTVGEILSTYEKRVRKTLVMQTKNNMTMGREMPMFRVIEHHRDHSTSAKEAAEVQLWVREIPMNYDHVEAPR